MSNSNSSSGRPRGSRFGVASLLALLAATNQFLLGHGFSSGISCPAESIACIFDSTCSQCVDTLQNFMDSAEGQGVEFADCGTLYADVCIVLLEDGCDTTNSDFIDLATCAADDLFGCSGFTTCADAFAATETPAPVAGSLPGTPPPTSAPSAAARALESAAPTASPSGAPELVETSSPTPADGSREIELTSSAPTSFASTSSAVEDSEETENAANGGVWVRPSEVMTALGFASVVAALCLAVV